ncbi:helix-turn-helix domain-containing protein [Haloplanus pelagicus]|jgi:predicted DNA binding protein|uniref:helix-turn-helix domain-containing protein n=1 Tax=Haloplanus pelagicus TaxID=2949995 RepID=UPI0020425DA1|nr:helix-turn-helix domain-containing protein [Haloplanus sp. HW8-1]
MREFAFRLRYEPGVDPLMDVCIDTPGLVGESLTACVSDDQFWRVEWFSGPSAALTTVERLHAEAGSRTESITETACEASRYYDVVGRNDDELVVYTFLTDVGGGESVQTLASRYLPAGSLFRTRRLDDRHEWRILLRSDEKVGLLYDALGATLRSGIAFRMEHLRDVEGWHQNPFESVSLSPEHRAAMQAAVDHGYYRTPRAITLDELASKLDLPRSTLSYRLRQAERTLVTGYLGGSGSE